MLLCLLFISSFLLLVLFRSLRHRVVQMVEVLYTEYRDLKNGKRNEWFGFRKLTYLLRCYMNRTLCNTSVSYLYFSGALTIFRKAIITFMSVRPSFRVEQLGSHWTDSHEIWCLSYFVNLSRQFKFYWNLTGITGIWHECSIQIYNISLNSS
jgi:hypothetical protein